VGVGLCELERTEKQILSALCVVLLQRGLNVLINFNFCGHIKHEIIS
jgi:hypothetical protein